LTPISTQTAPSARTVGDFRQSLAFLHVPHPPSLYILVLAVRCLLHIRPPGVTVESAGLSLDAYQHSGSTQQDPSARTVGDFRQSLAFLHVSHLPVLYIPVLEVGYLLHMRPSGVLGVSEGHSSDAYRHSDGTQYLNCRGFPSVTGVSACLASTCTLHTSAESGVSSAHTAPRCAWGV